MPKITISHSSGAENKYGLEGKIFTIGRAPDNDITLPDGSSSNYHAVLKLSESGDFSLSDLGSTNHTRVNGKRISTRELRNGDHLLFGDTLAVYESEFERGAPPEESPPQGEPSSDQPSGRPATIKAPKRQPSAATPPPAGGDSQTPQHAVNSNSGCLGLIVASAIVVAVTLAAAGVAVAAIR